MYKRQIYWAVTTVTSTGYGDLVPITPAGRIVGSVIMFLSVALVALSLIHIFAYEVVLTDEGRRREGDEPWLTCAVRYQPAGERALSLIHISAPTPW